MTYTPDRAQIRYQELTGYNAFRQGATREQVTSQPHVPKILMEARLRGYDAAASRKEKEQGK